MARDLALKRMDALLANAQIVLGKGELKSEWSSAIVGSGQLQRQIQASQTERAGIPFLPASDPTR